MDIRLISGRIPQSLRPILWPVICGLLLSTLTLLVYFPGLSGDYEFDDTVNIVDNKALIIDSLTPATLFRASITGGIAGPLKRPISVATLVINRYLTGLDPFYMKLTNVVIHTCNGLSIFYLSWLLLVTYYRKQQNDIPKQTILWIAFAISALWTLHPLALTSILYIIQRMTSISALFTIWGLISYVIARRRMIQNGKGEILLIASFIAFILLGAFSKENGLLLPLYTFIIEITFFNFQSFSKPQKYFLIGFYIIVLIIPFLAGCIWLLLHTDWLVNGYKTRTFSLTERLLTETRVLWFYLRLIILPNTSLMGLFHDDIPISHSLLSPWTTLPSLIGIFILAIGAFLTRNRKPILSFGVLFFLAGHSMESTIIPLEIAHEHRNYLPMYGILFIIGFYILDLQSQLIASRPRAIFMAIFVFLIAGTTYIRTGYWGDITEHTLMEVRNHPKSGRAQYQAGSIYWKLALANPEKKQEFFELAREHLEKATLNVNYQNDSYLALIQLSYFANIKMNPEWFDKLLEKLQFAPFPASTTNIIHSFTLCEIDQTCKLSPENLNKIYNAALNNPTLGGISRANILSTAALYAANNQNFEKSIKYLREASRFSGNNLSYRLVLIDLLIQLDRLEEAKKELAIIKKKDKYSLFNARIAKEEKMLLERDKRDRENVNQTKKPNGQPASDPKQ